MQESYRVGVTLALKGNVQTIVSELVKQFEKLDTVIKTTQASTKKLSADMATLGKEGRSAAQEWQKAAAAMERAAQAATRAAGASMRPPAGGMGYLPAPTPTGGPRRTRGAGQAVQSYYYGQGVSAGQVGLNNEASGQFQLVGPPYGGGPGRALVPVPGSERTHDYARSPDRGALTRYEGPRYGATVPYSSAGGMGETVFDEPFNAPGDGGRIPLDPRDRRRRTAAARGPSHHDYVAQGVTAYGGFEWLKSMYEATAHVKDIQAGMLNQGFTKAQVDEATKKAFDLQRSIPGSTVGGNLEIASKSMAVVQSAQESIDMMGAFAEFDRTMTLTNHTREGQDLMSAIRAGEFRGVLTHKDAQGHQVADLGQLVPFLHLLSSLAINTHGDIGPAQVRQFLLSGGISGGLISDKELTRQAAMMITMGSSRAGRSLQAFQQQFVAGKMNQVTADLLIKEGIVKGGGDAKHNPFMRKVGVGSFQILPGGMAPGVQEQAATDTSLFMSDYLLPKFQQEITKVYGKAYTEADDKHKLIMESSFAMSHSSRMPGGVEMAEIIRNILLLGREEQAAERQLKRPVGDALKTQVDNNPKVQQDALFAAYNAFLVSLGNTALKPAIEALNTLTGWLNDLASWARANPDGAKAALEGLAAGIAAFGISAAAGLAMKSLTKGPTSFAALAGGITALGAAMGSFPDWLVKIITAGYGGYKVGGAPGAVLAGVGAGAFEGAEAARKLVAGNPAFKGYHMVPFGPGGTMILMPDSTAPAAAPAAPIPKLSSGGKEPVDVRVVNSGDHANGVAKNIGNKMNRPPDGPTLPNVNLSPGGAYFGNVFTPP